MMECELETCMHCGEQYDRDDSTNSDPDRQFCGCECEIGWLAENPSAEYNGELDQPKADGGGEE